MIRSTTFQTKIGIYSSAEKGDLGESRSTKYEKNAVWFVCSLACVHTLHSIFWLLRIIPTAQFFTIWFYRSTTQSNIGYSFTGRSAAVYGDRNRQHEHGCHLVR